MKVFSTFFKITKQNKAVIIIYLILFLGISSMTSTNNLNTKIESFESTKVPIAVIDRDQSVTSKGIYQYLDSIHTLIDIVDSKEAFQDELYYRNILYILIIPDNFEKNLIAGNEVSCENIQVPNSISGIYVNMQLEQIFNILKSYLILGIDPQEALSKTITLVNQSAKVTVDIQENSVTDIPKYYNFFAVIPYPLLGILISILGVILLVFNQEDLKRRTICSALSLKKRNSQLTLASLVVSFGVLLVLLIFPLFSYGTDMLTNPMYPYLVLNSLAFLFVAMSIGFLTGIISKKEEHVGIFSTSLSLFFTFMGGIFVSFSIMPEKVVFFSKFVPTYWYTQVIETVKKNRSLEGKSFNNVLFSLGIQLMFAAVIFGISLVISRKKAQQA